MNQLEVFKALANESRLQILFWLKDPKCYFTHEEPVDMVEVGVCVGQIQLRLGVTQSTASQYLSVLQKADLVIATRIGKWTYYRRNEEAIAKLAKLVETEL